MRIVLAGLGCSGLALIALFSIAQGAIAQVTGAGETIVTPVGNQLEITNGAVAGNNLFHNFQQFSLNHDQAAIFQRVPPNTTHIFAQVLGGTVSNIDGKIQIEGGNAPNLYLMNPAGIVFGPNAVLNLGNAFVGTTASGLDFGNGIFDRNNLDPKLTGLPQRLLFSPGEPGVIINSMKDTSIFAQQLAFIAGTVYSAMPITLPDAVTAVTVNGNTAVRVGVEGSLLSFDIDPTKLNGTALPFTPAKLPELITGNTVQAGQIYLDQVSVRSNCGSCPTSITLKSRDAIKTKDLVTGNSGKTVLQANGNITVESIYTGDKGLTGYSGGTLQVTGRIKITDNLTRQLVSPVSIRSGVPINLRHNGATTSGTLMNGTVININGNGKSFIVGPNNTGQLQALSTNESGTGGAIVLFSGSGDDPSGGGIPLIIQAQVFGGEQVSSGGTIVISDGIISGADPSGPSNFERSNISSTSPQGLSIPIANRDCSNTPQTRTVTQRIAQRSATKSSTETTDSCGTSKTEGDEILTILEDDLKTAISESTVSP